VTTAARLALLLASGALFAACANDEAASEGTNEVASAGPAATAPTTGHSRPASARPTSYPEDDYTFVMSHMCECVDVGVRITITVEDGRAVDARYTQDSDDHKAGERVSDKRQWLTLNDLIDMTHTNEADNVRVYWPDNQLYPKAIDVDYDLNTADDEVGYFVYHVSTGVAD
jgi:Family of unknown function (DUF6174)